MKIALLTKYGDLAASTRQRFEQYRPFLETAGFEIVSRPLLDNSYLRQLYAGGSQSGSQEFPRKSRLQTQNSVPLLTSMKPTAV